MVPMRNTLNTERMIKRETPSSMLLCATKSALYDFAETITPEQATQIAAAIAQNDNTYLGLLMRKPLGRLFQTLLSKTP